MTESHDIRRYEEISNNAWPALKTVQYDGWILRFARGVTKRANSINLLYPSTIPPAEKVAFCEKICRHESVAPCFKVTPAAEPSGIDGLLAGQGYGIRAEISFQTLPISARETTFHDDIRISSAIRPAWIDHFIRMNGFDAARRPVYAAIMRQVVTPMCMVTLEKEGAVAGVGLGVVEGRHLGIFDIVVAAEHRRLGAGRTIVGSILSWGAGQGAKVAYLQVLTDNLPALNLYDEMGFREIYRYWYRMKDG